MTHAFCRHRALAAAHAEVLARDGDLVPDGNKVPGHGGALLPSRQRALDLRTMNTTSNRRVLLTTLSVRMSSKGNEYLSGYLAKARVVAFKGEPDKYGQETWNVYLSEPEPRDGRQGADSASTHRERQERVSAAIASGVDLDDNIPF